ncbi:MAG: glycosyltransferase [Clostridia bacterium]|nr:glycosyltransferase [Clostridia bacterium]
MKVLQVNVVYNTGSTGKIMCDIHAELVKQGIESVICYGRGKKTQDKNVYKICGELYSKFNNLLSRFTGLLYGGCYFSTQKLFRIIKKEKPDIVHLHCLNGHFVNIYKLIAWLKKHHVKTVLTLHAEFMHTANCSHAFECDKWLSGCGKCPKLQNKHFRVDGTHRSWKKMKKAFADFDSLTVASVSPWLQERAARSPILKGLKHITVLNGLDTEVFRPTLSDLREKYALTDKTVVFHASPRFDNNPSNLKGGYYVLQLAERMPETVFVVAGPYPDGLMVPDNVILLGKVANQTLLTKWYSTADITLLTSKRETFSMIVAESLCCGTPVVGFYAGGPETIAVPQYCVFVEYGDVDALTVKAEEVIRHSYDLTEISKVASRKYSKSAMCANYVLEYQTEN